MKGICIALLTAALLSNACAVADTVDPVRPGIIESGDYSDSVHGESAAAVKHNEDEGTVEIPSGIGAHPVAAAAEAGEYDFQKQSAPDGPRGGQADSAPEEPEEMALEIVGGTASLGGVTVTLEKAAAAKDQNPDRFTYAFSGTLENSAEEGIMQVVYTITLIDGNGEEFRTFTEVYDGEDAALPPHAKTGFAHDGIRSGPQTVPAAVKIGISSFKTESELPPAHIPRPGEYLYRALGDEKLENIPNEMPVELSFHVDQGGYGRTAVFREGAALDKAVELFCAIRIGEKPGAWVTDNYNWIGLAWEDGSYSYISLNLYSLEYFVHSVPHTFELENLGAFWSYCFDFLEEDR